MTARSLVVTLVLSCLMLPIAASASCTGTPVESHGAVGNGTTDDTNAIQNTINAVAANGGGSVVLGFKRYYTTGTLNLPAGVVLCGASEGPYDIAGNPATTTIAPTLLVTNNANTFITLSGANASVTDILFYYPNQADPSASAPISYPWTIQVFQPGAKIRRCTAVNAYQFLDIEVGRVAAEHLLIGAFLFGVYVDHAQDRVTLNNIIQTTAWDFPSGSPTGTNLDNWVHIWGTAFAILRADSLEIHNVLVFFRSSGFYLTDSPDTSQGTLSGYGMATNIDLDSVNYGIVARSTNGPGFKFVNLDVAAVNSAVVFQDGGSISPTIEVNGGSVRGTLAGGAFPTPSSGQLVVVNVLGYNF